MAMDPPAAPPACGRDLETLYEHVSAGTLDDHEQSCPHCRWAADDVRRAVRIAAHAQLGLDLRTIDIEVEDVHAP